MEADAASDGDADAAQLVATQPDAAVGRIGAGIEAPVAGRTDHGLFEAGDEVNDLQAPAVEADDRIDHQLARSVVGDVAAPVRGHHRDAFLGQERVGDAQVFPTAAAAQGEDAGMFDAQDHVGFQATACFGIHYGQLQVEGFRVVGLWQVHPPAGRHLAVVFFLCHGQDSVSPQ